MNPTKRIDDYLKVNRDMVYLAVFSGELKQTIYFRIAGDLGSSLLSEEVAFLDQHIQHTGSEILKKMKDLQPGTGVKIVDGPHQGQEGVIVDIIGPSSSQDKRRIQYRVEIEQKEQPVLKLIVDYLASEIERKQMPKGILSTGVGRP
jgi:hypothetical protein